jgi:hypothetical protein
MKKIDEIILSSAKSVYGVAKEESGASVPLGFGYICAWSLVGYDTLEELEAAYSDEEILQQFNSLQEQLHKMAS